MKTIKRDLSRLVDCPERRTIAVSDFEIRKNGDVLSLDGYASVFEAPYELYGGAEAGGWDETVDLAAFDVTLREKPDLHLLINHEGMPLARTKSGTLQLSTDKHGLRVLAPNLDRRDPDVQRLEVKMERGDMDEMSFAFRVQRQEWNEDYTERRLLEISLHKGDVSVVNFGANPATSAQLNSLLSGLAHLDLEDALTEARAANQGDLSAAAALLAKLVHETQPTASRGMSTADALRILTA
jgi:HK97 family phage prohead protease